MKGGVAMMLAAFMRASASEAAAGRRDPVPDEPTRRRAAISAPSSSSVSTRSCSTASVTRSASSAASPSTWRAGASTRSWSPRSRSAGRGDVPRPAGHGSMPIRDGAATLGKLPERARPQAAAGARPGVARSMVDAIAADVPANLAVPLRALLRGRSPTGCSTCSATRGLFDPLLHNTACATIIDGGEKINVIPGEVSVELDGRLLPGFGPATVRRAARARGRRDGARGDPPRRGLRRAEHGAVRGCCRAP